jgi:hypothetical protein
LLFSAGVPKSLFFRYNAPIIPPNQKENFMHTLILEMKPRTSSSGTTYSIDVVGDSPVKESVRASIQALEHHPAKASRRSLIDILSLIEQHNFRICHTEHYFEGEIEHWLFVVQG